jgi:hypothetical protein
LIPQLSSLPPAGSSKVLKQTIGGDQLWWQALLDSWLGGWLQGVTA